MRVIVQADKGIIHEITSEILARDATFLEFVPGTVNAPDIDLTRYEVKRIWFTPYHTMVIFAKERAHDTHE